MPACAYCQACFVELAPERGGGRGRRLPCLAQETRAWASRLAKVSHAGVCAEGRGAARYSRAMAASAAFRWERRERVRQVGIRGAWLVTGLVAESGLPRKRKPRDTIMQCRRFDPIHIHRQRGRDLSVKSHSICLEQMTDAFLFVCRRGAGPRAGRMHPATPPNPLILTYDFPFPSPPRQHAWRRRAAPWNRVKPTGFCPRSVRLCKTKRC